jgi:hypothetical protein
LIAWATDAEATALTRHDLLAHHAIVERIFAATSACLPARFRTPVSAELVRSRYDDLVTALARVSNCAELGVTALWASQPARANSGTAYLRARAEQLATARRIARQLEAACGADLVEAQHREVPSDAVALSSALLVERNHADNAKQRLLLDTRSVRILVHGPWPPYTFAALGPAREE